MYTESSSYSSYSSSLNVSSRRKQGWQSKSTTATSKRSTPYQIIQTSSSTTMTISSYTSDSTDSMSSSENLIDCNICCLASADVTYICNNKNCKAQLCGTCKKSNWSNVVPGGKFYGSAIDCPYCKRSVTSSDVKDHNAKLAEIIDNIELDSYTEYVWCNICNNVAEFVHNEDQISHLQDESGEWICDGCKTPAQRRSPCCNKLYTKSIGDDDAVYCKPCKRYWCFVCAYYTKEYARMFDHFQITHNGKFNDSLAEINEELWQVQVVDARSTYHRERDQLQTLHQNQGNIDVTTALELIAAMEANQETEGAATPPLRQEPQQNNSCCCC